MSKLTAEETSELIHKAEESRKLIDELREKLHQANLAIATEKARADRLEKTAPKKCTRTCPTQQVRQVSTTAADR
jgi:hypothetical protein